MYAAVAEQIIREQFAGHTDKGGQPYIGHLLRVRATVAEQGGDDICQSIALLHDLLEDTDYPPEELARQLRANPRHRLSIQWTLEEGPK